MNELSGEGMAYDLGARFYDARLGRMFSIDTYSGKYPYRSPFAYCGNSPVFLVDIKGARLKPNSKTGEIGGTIYFRFDNSVSPDDRLKYIANFAKQIEADYKGKKYNGKAITLNIKYEEYKPTLDKNGDEIKPKLKEGENLFTVGKDDPDDDLKGDFIYQG